MSYQVLARKWRPKNFAEMVGQEHVLRALQNALNQNRLHHAYLFTGTRGVGKTTLARILAKCLNCDHGVTATPCGECGSCLSISEGRMVDLIEVDAASRTKVEDTRELLENVQYAPTQGRYKVYIIDEVHMLTVNSFNALLKTLEEPPPHVKFLLATTDPQKLPVTVLSRCLQFHLKNMSPERIVGHLEHILSEESMAFEPSALWQLAHAADGSMRDALSLTDQAIGYGDRTIREQDVSAMLGTLNQQWVLRLLQALANSDVADMFATMENISELSPDYNGLLSDIIALLHRLAIAQVLPSGLDNRDGLRSDLLKLATQIPSEDVQLFYQSALISRRDLSLSPNPKAGVEMALLRMLAFRPQGVVDLPKTALNAAEDNPNTSPPENAPADAEPSLGSTQVDSEPNPSIGEAHLNHSSSKNEAITHSLDGQPDTAAADSATKKKTRFEGVDHLIENLANIDSAPPLQPDAAVDEQSSSGAQAIQVSSSTSPSKSLTHSAVTTRAPRSTADRSGNNTAAAVQSSLPKAPQQQLAPQQLAPQQLAPQDTQASSPPSNLVPPSEWQAGDWLTAFHHIATTGIVKSIASNCEFTGADNQTLQFVLSQDHSVLYNDNIPLRLAEAINRYFNSEFTVAIEIGETQSDTPTQVAERIKAQKQAEAITAIHDDPFIQAVTQAFDAVIDPKNISAKV